MLISLDGSCILAAAYILGIGLHQTIFRYGEWDLHSFKILVAFSVVPIFLGTFLQSFHLPSRGKTTWESLEYSSVLVFIAICGIFSSISVYRGWFHRLNEFPGPFLARFSTFYMTFVNIAEARGFKTTQALHSKYGDIVRVGPRELSVANPEAFRAIHLSSSCGRGPWYNVTAPMISLQMERGVKRHGERRRAWDKAFDNRALGDYMTRVNAHTENFCAAIEDSVKNNTSLNVTKWIHLYSFDIMGDLAFGSSFDMLQSGTFHYFFNLTHKTLELIAIFSRLVWLFPVVKAVPFLSNDYKSFRKWVGSHVQRRIAVPPPVRDIFSWILNDYQRKQNPSWQDTENLYGDASLIVIAGSDTVAGTLICLLYHLASSPDVCKKLRDELHSCAKERADTELRPDELAKLPYLQACIDETLRLWPAVVDGLQRETPPEGLTIGTEKKSTWIPGNVIIKTPSYTLCRDPRAFSRPDEFIPERWTTEPELILDASVYAPFSLGRFSCVGKRLAMVMMRRFISSIILRYELEVLFKSAQDAFERQVKEYFTLTPPDLQIRFIKEQKG